MIFKGQNLRVFASGKCIAAALDCTFSFKNNLEDSTTKSTKDNDGSNVVWEHNDIVSKGWSVRCKTLFDPTATGGDVVISRGLLDSAIAGGDIVIAWQTTNGEQNRVASKVFGYSGSAILETVDVTAENRKDCESDFVFRGNGPLSSIVD